MARVVPHNGRHPFANARVQDRSAPFYRRAPRPGVLFMNSRKYLIAVLVIFFLIIAAIFVTGAFQSATGTANGM